jgi:hypothetical protein
MCVEVICTFLKQNIYPKMLKCKLFNNSSHEKGKLLSTDMRQSKYFIHIEFKLLNAKEFESETTKCL